MSLSLRELLAAEGHGVLATHSARFGGWPFASVAQYALTSQGEPLLLLSDLAEHTHNVRADARASLLVQDTASLGDPRAGARATLLGHIQPVGSSELGVARASYLARHSRASELFEMADFHLFVLRTSRARIIGGFGDMGWLEGDRLRAALRP